MSALWPAPLIEADGVAGGPELALAVLVGLAFGWTLERAGLGHAPKLAGQFQGTDFTVLKVMFTALTTALLGSFWLARWGLLDLSRVAVPETFWAPQIAGGALFGLGFAVAGLCPGTSCVAAASGRGDGASAALGLLTGVVAAGLAPGAFEAFRSATPAGALTLPEALGLPYGLVVALVTAMALSACALAERLEARR